MEDIGFRLAGAKSRNTKRWMLTPRDTALEKAQSYSQAGGTRAQFRQALQGRRAGQKSRW